MNVKFTGKIIAAGQVQMGTSQNGTQWSSCEYTIEELNEQYPSRAVIQVYGSDKLQQFNIQLGEIITAHIGLKARQSKEGRWFNQLDCWRVERPNVQQQGQVSQNSQYAPPQQQFPPQVNASGQATQQGVQYSGGQQQNIPFPQR
jgi:hypothetical protein